MTKPTKKELREALDEVAFEDSTSDKDLGLLSDAITELMELRELKKVISGFEHWFKVGLGEEDCDKIKKAMGGGE